MKKCLKFSFAIISLSACIFIGCQKKITYFNNDTIQIITNINNKELSNPDDINISTVRGEALALILRGSTIPKVSEKTTDIAIANHNIEGDLIIDGINYNSNLTFKNCKFNGDIEIRGSYKKILKFKNCDFNQKVFIDGITADYLQIINCGSLKEVVITNSKLKSQFGVSTFSGPSLEIQRLSSEIMIFENLKVSNFTLLQNSVSKSIEINAMTIKNTFLAQNNDFSNSISIYNSNFLGDIYWEDFGHPRLFCLKDNTISKPIFLYNFQPSTLRINNNSSSNVILAFLEENTIYNKANYNYFMDFFKKQDDNKAATVFYRSIKKHEFEEMSPFEYIFNKLAFLIGYGQYPDFICWALLGMYAVNCLVFWKKFMKPTSEKPCYRFSFWSKLLYCLEILVPFFQFKVKSEWQPKPEYRLVKFVLVLSTMIGYICFSLLTIIIIKILIVE